MPNLSSFKPTIVSAGLIGFMGTILAIYIAYWDYEGSYRRAFEIAERWDYGELALTIALASVTIPFVSKFFNERDEHTLLLSAIALAPILVAIYEPSRDELELITDRMFFACALVAAVMYFAMRATFKVIKGQEKYVVERKLD